MPSSTVLTFTNALNVSCQIGDTAYYVPTSSSSSFTINSSSVIEIGIISAINQSAMTITVGNSLVASVPNGSFILFSKDNKANQSNALGYFAEITMASNSTSSVELFSVGVEIFESSK
jgi:hypothetical protein|tara:strand:+ start:153 stop:506 length:354 start_codon:yes stop_codon:yes gene_type:complete